MLCLITYKVRPENGYGFLRPSLKTGMEMAFFRLKHILLFISQQYVTIGYIVLSSFVFIIGVTNFEIGFVMMWFNLKFVPIYNLYFVKEARFRALVYLVFDSQRD